MVKHRIEKVICTCDWHVPFNDKDVTDKFFSFLKDYQPDEIVLNGNMNDCSAFSHHPKKKEVALAFRTAREEREHWFPIAEQFRNTCPDSKIVYVGSDCHEGWIDMWAAQSDLLIDDPQYELPNWLRFNDYSIDYCHREYIKNGFIFTHGTCCRGESGLTAKQELLYHGINGASGHTHRLGSYYKTSRGIPRVWFECGCMCQRDAWYKLKGKAKYMDWQQGFLSMTFEGEVFSGQLIPVIRNAKDNPRIYINGNSY